jgi:hypothetical protein
MRTSIAALVLTLLFIGSARPIPATVHAQAAPAAATSLSDADIERFLSTARVIRTRGTSKGVTGSLRATLTDGPLTHDAQIQTIDQSKREFHGKHGTEFNFRDSWAFNVAAYKLDRMLGLHLIPVSVQRNWRTQQAAYTWWIDDVEMDEADRQKNRIAPGKPELWNEQMQLVRVFDQLIYNTDRNLGNLLIAKDWRVWAIDHTRAFRQVNTLRSPENLTRCDRQLLERMKQLDRASLKRELGRYLGDWDIDAMLARRDLIVAHFEQRGPGALFDRQAAGAHQP